MNQGRAGRVVGLTALSSVTLIGPLVLATTVVMVGSGIGLVVTGPTYPLLYIHVISALVWLPVIAIHSVAHIRQIPRNLVNEWSHPSTVPLLGRGLRLGVNLGALILGAIGAILLFPAATPLLAWSQANVIGPGPFIVGMIVSAGALAVTRVFRRW